MNFAQLIQTAISKAGKQESLAVVLGMNPSNLSKRINGETGWQEEDMNKLLNFMEMSVVDSNEFEKKLKALKATIKLLLEEQQG